MAFRWFAAGYVTRIIMGELFMLAHYRLGLHGRFCRHEHSDGSVSDIEKPT